MNQHQDLMNQCTTDVLNMHHKYTLPINAVNKYLILSDRVLNFRYSLLKEEYDELMEATMLVDAIDAMIDICYIACGNIVVLPVNKVTEKYTINYQSYLVGSHIPTGYTEFIRDYKMHSFNERYRAAIIDCFKLLYFTIEVFKSKKLSFKAHWDVVHEANMTKVKSSEKNPSSRGDTTGMDLVKPEGWVGPDHAKLLDQHRIATPLWEDY